MFKVGDTVIINNKAEGHYVHSKPGKIGVVKGVDEYYLLVFFEEFTLCPEDGWTIDVNHCDILETCGPQQPKTFLKIRQMENRWKSRYATST